MESEENRKQVFTPFPLPLEIAIKMRFPHSHRRDGDGIASLLKPKEGPAHSEAPLIDS